jgi:hypothetical protein
MTPTLLSPEARSSQQRLAGPRVVSLTVRRTFSSAVPEDANVRLRHTGGAGHLWITFEGQATDHVLSPGEALQFRGPGLLVIEALEGGAQIRIA